jgi:hypothetical protein
MPFARPLGPGHGLRGKPDATAAVRQLAGAACLPRRTVLPHGRSHLGVSRADALVPLEQGGQVLCLLGSNAEHNARLAIRLLE